MQYVDCQQDTVTRVERCHRKKIRTSAVGSRLGRLFQWIAWVVGKRWTWHLPSVYASGRYLCLLLMSYDKRQLKISSISSPVPQA